MTFHSQNQMHIAQQFRREKLRVTGIQTPLSPQRDEDNSHISRSKSSMGLLPIPQDPKRAKTFDSFGFSSGFETGSDGNILPNLISDVCQRFNAENTSSDSFPFSSCPGSVYGNQSIFPGDSVYTKRLSTPSNWMLSLHGQIQSHTPGSVFVSDETSIDQNGMNNDHSSRYSPAGESFSADVNSKGRCVGERSKEFSMDAFLGGSASQQEAFQFCGVNQDVQGYHDSLQGNVLLVGPSLLGSNQSVGSEATLAGVQLPAHALSHVHLPHQATMAVMPVPNQKLPSSVLVSHLGNQSNIWQNGGGELMFVPMSGCVEPNQEGMTQPGQNFDLKNTYVPGYEMRHSLVLQGSDKAFAQGGMKQNLHIGQSQDPNTGLFQGLSLSLSSLQPSVMQLNSFPVQLSNPEIATSSSIFPHTIEDVKLKLSEGFSKRLQVLSNPLHNSKDLFLASDTICEESKVLAGANQLNHSSGSTMLPGNPRMLASSKYFKVAQHVLEEVCSVIGPLQKDGNISQISANKSHERTVSKANPYENLQSDNTASESSKKDVANAGGLATVSMSRSAENSNLLTQEDKQHLQTRKAKLMSMLQEVDRQYRQYSDHMQAVIFSFDSAVGHIGAAQHYTRMAVKAISRHFRSLRDTITNQIKVTCKALGEKDTFESTPFRKVTSRLKFVDQQLRQQRALQQIGMLQQPAWRPQRGLPEHSVSILRACLFENFLHPYPKDADKTILARQTGLSKNQVSNWFINARVRLWKPMVEEMYLEENKQNGVKAPDKVEQVRDEGTSTQQKHCEHKNGDTVLHDEMMQDDIKHIQNDTQVNEKMLADEPRHLDNFGTKDMDSNNALKRNSQTDHTNGLPSVSTSSSGMYDVSMNKARDMPFTQNMHPNYNTRVLNSTFEKSMDFRSKDSVSNILYEDDYRAGSLKRYSSYPLTVQSGSILHHHTTSDDYNISNQNLNVYPQMDVPPNVFDSSAVSLTLGLQYIDPLSQVNSHNYIDSAHNISESNRSNDFRLNVVGHKGNLDHEGLNFQSGKHVTNHLLHGFVS